MLENANATLTTQIVNPVVSKISVLIVGIVEINKWIIRLAQIRSTIRHSLVKSGKNVPVIILV